ncbi:MAG: CehA/McbA family metallohydrolase [Myxococcota bacterium]
MQRVAALLVFGATVVSCGDPPPGFARASRIASLDQAVGGPKAIARPGDFLLENSHLKVAILGARDSLGPGLYGGSIVDADLVRTDPRFSGGNGNDRLAELFPTVNMNVAHPEDESTEVAVVADGSSGEAIVRVQGTADPFLSLLDALWGILRAPDFYLWTDYVARADEPWITIRTTVTTGVGGGDVVEGDPIPYHDAPFPLVDWAIETGLVLGDFYLQGGSVDVFAPGIGFDEDGAVYASMQAGENSFLEPFQYAFLAGVADGVSYGLAPKDGDLFVPLFTASQTVAVGGAIDGDGTDARIPPGQAYTYERYFFVGDGDVGSVLDQYIDARGLPHGTVSGVVLEQPTLDPVSGISVFVYEPGADAPFSQFETDVSPDDHQADGSFGGSLPVGTWELQAHQRGRPDAPRVTVKIREGEEATVALGAGRFGVLSFEVRDETGRKVPAKVTLFRADGGDPTIDPVRGDGFVAGSPEAVVFAMYGSGQVELPPGKFVAVASRGLEYEIDRSEPFEIGAAQSAELDLVVVRSVDTAGWVSADLHVHGVASHDSAVSQADRVRTMVAEGVEFFASTDHDYLVDYAPTVEALGLEEWVQTAIGNETTTVEVGHFLAFPLGQDFLTEAGGGRDGVDWTGKQPADIIGSLETMGKAAGHDPMVFVGHPRDGILGYFDQYGFDPFGGTPGVGGTPGLPKVTTPLLSAVNPLLGSGAISWEFDGLELLNGKRLELLRTPTQPEMDGFVAGTADVYDFMSRTLAEQADLETEVYPLSPDLDGQVDDWFTLLNLGFRYTALGNSDTHGLTSTEAGCPRNFVLTDEDDPAFLDDQAVADAVKAHRVVASYGPFVRMWIDGQPIGSELVSDGEVELLLDVQAPAWVAVDRVELYENGVLIREWDVPDTTDVMRFSETIALTPTRDAWYVAAVMGDGDLAPVFTPVEIPYVDLQSVVTEALAGVETLAGLIDPAVPFPREFAIAPYALTNPIWVDRAGDGFDAPGLPTWLHDPAR